MHQNLIDRRLETAWPANKSGFKGLSARLHDRVHKMARAKSIEALEVQVKLMLDKNQPGHVRLAAASAVLDRAWGKPKEQVEVSNEAGIPMLTLRFVNPDGGEADETITITQPAQPALEAPGEQATFTLPLRPRK